MGFLFALVLAGGVSFVEIFGLSHWPISEGNPAVQFGVQLGLGMLMVCGIALLIPALPHIAKSSDKDSLEKVLWIFLLVFFPYFAPYIYFRKYFETSRT